MRGWRRHGVDRSMKLLVLACMLALLVVNPIIALENAEIRELLQRVTVRVDILPESGASESIAFGSGFFVSETGLICTNFHVIEDSLRYGYPIRVQLQNGNTYDADIVHWGARRDWAVLQISARTDFPYVEFAFEPQILDDIWSAGYPVTGNFKIIGGMINSYQPDFMHSGLDYFDVSMNFDGGNSGGPVIDRDGKVVGIVVAYYSEARGFDFIIPIEEVADEIYWLRYLLGSEAYVPYHVSQIEPAVEPGQEIPAEDYFTVVNRTGEDIWYLYIVDDKLLDEGALTYDFLGDEILYTDSYFHILTRETDWVDQVINVVWGERLVIFGEDYDGVLYYQEWYPDLDPWEIELTRENIYE